MPVQPKRPSLSIPVRSRADAIGTGAERARPVLLAFAALAAPIGLRAMLLVEHATALGVGDLRGLFSDVSVALCVAVAVGLLARLRRSAGVGLLLLWVLLCYGNFEHVSANGGNMALRDAGYLTDVTFLRGSALAITRPWLLVGALVVALGFGLAALRAGGRVRLRALAISCAASVAAFAFWSASPEMLGWRQTSFVAQNASWLVDAIAAREPVAPGAPVEPVALDLDGEPLVAFGDAKTNVLLVLLEGVSGAYIEPIVVANDQRPFGISMPELSRIARDHVFFTSFIAQQRQTNRGEYAVLCGDLPRLSSAEPKMTLLATGSDLFHGKRCLPAALAEAGYATVYLQGAPMTFMLKDKFIPSIGFERSLGDAYFDDAYSRNEWGVDDRTLLQQSLRVIEELRDAGRPWFLTLLTVGTHHPLNIPAEVLKNSKLDHRRLAFAYLDSAVGEFVAELDARGVLDDTLVLLTSDESQGLYGKVTSGKNRLSQNWGFLIALLPGGTKLRVDTPQAQFDIALSTLDWLGLADYASGFLGRSVFRRYAKPRALAFGNTFYSMVGGLSADGQLVLCREDLTQCTRGPSDEQRLFEAALEMSPGVSAGDIAFLRELVVGSMRVSGFGSGIEGRVASSAERDFRLSEAENFEIRDDVGEMQYVFGGQYLSVPANSRIDVELEVEVIGKDGRIEVLHELMAHEAPRLFWKRIPDMRPGDRFHTRYSYSTVEPMSEIVSYLGARRVSGSGLSLNLPRARIRIQPEPDSSEPPLVVHQFDIERAPRPDDPKRAARRR